MVVPFNLIEGVIFSISFILDMPKTDFNKINTYKSGDRVLDLLVNLLLDLTFVKTSAVLLQNLEALARLKK